MEAVGALAPHMSVRQLQAALAAHAGAGLRALLAVVQHGPADLAAVGLWALANLASTPLAARAPQPQCAQPTRHSAPSFHPFAHTVPSV